MHKRINFISALICQLLSVIYGLVVPRLIIGYFGSEVNGLISSITQFLGFISLLEGGLGAVVLAELYSPIENNDTEHIRKVICACQRLFSIIGIVFVGYTIILAFVLPITIGGSRSFEYVCLLVFILSLSTFSQYVFSITNKLLLQAQQKIYIVNFVTSATFLVNVIIAVIVVKFYPNVHFLKLFSSIAFFIQPIIYSRFVDKKYKTSIFDKNIKYKLENRWSGFGQNIAHFINMNTDIIVVTIFIGLTSVSVYSVYMLAVIALRNLVSTINNSYQSVFGKYYVESHEKLTNSFTNFSLFNLALSSSLFMTCLLLINPFVSLYVGGAKDANYYEPVFALIIIIANYLYSVREPFRLVILSAGKFKKTNFGSFMEAGLNLFISILLVKFLGLVGIAIGTLIAIGFRLLYFMWFLKKDVLLFEYKKYLPHFLKASALLITNIVLFFVVDFHISNFYMFILIGAAVFLTESLVAFSCLMGPKKMIQYFRHSFFKTNIK